MFQKISGKKIIAVGSIYFWTLGQFISANQNICLLLCVKHARIRPQNMKKEERKWTAAIKHRYLLFLIWMDTYTRDGCGFEIL